MSESTAYTVNGTRVKGQGWSYNLTNQKDAERLCNTLNTYHKASVEYQTIEAKLDKIQKTIISLQMSCSIMTTELQKLHEEVIQ